MRELSLSDMGSEYKPMKSSGSVKESEVERVPTKRMRCSKEPQATTTSALYTQMIGQEWGVASVTGG